MRMTTIEAGHPDASDIWVLGKNWTPEERQRREELAEMILSISPTKEPFKIEKAP